MKTERFRASKYVGDPLNAVRIFNEKEVDELIVVDIAATVEGREPAYELIASLARECRMPMCYSGGVTTADQIEAIVSLGVEKVALSYAALRSPSVVSEGGRRVGRQSIVVVMDVGQSGRGRRYELFTHNGTRNTGIDPVEFARQMEEQGAGEIVINSINLDGTMKGYDIGLARSVKKAVTLPVTVLGGAGTLEDIAGLFRELGIVGAAAGSLFVFKGKYRAVLINYPNRAEKEALLTSSERISQG